MVEDTRDDSFDVLDQLPQPRKMSRPIYSQPDVFDALDPLKDPLHDMNMSQLPFFTSQNPESAAEGPLEPDVQLFDFAKTLDFINSTPAEGPIHWAGSLSPQHPSRCSSAPAQQVRNFLIAKSGR